MWSLHIGFVAMWFSISGNPSTAASALLILLFWAPEGHFLLMLRSSTPSQTASITGWFSPP